MKKNCSIDIIRVFCAFLVVVQHVPVFIGNFLYDNQSWYFFTSRIARIAVPYFFIVSGYFYIKKLKSGKETFKKQIYSLLRIYVLWCILYLPYHTWLVIQRNTGLIGLVKSSIYDFLFEGYGWQMWYIPALIFAVLCATIAHKMNLLKQFAIASVVIYALGVILLAYSNLGLMKNIEVFSKILSLKHFTTFRRFVLFGMPLFMSGFFVDSFMKWYSSSKIKEISLIFIVAMLFFMEQQTIINLGGQTVMTFCLYPLILMVISLCIHYPNENKINLASFSKINSNILYFSHVLIFWTIYSVSNSISGFWLYCVTVLLCTSISYFLYSYKGKWAKLLHNLY